MHVYQRTLVNLAVIGILTTSTSHSAGFSLYTESSAAAEGNFAAGIAAEAADASTGWYNPAGLILIKKQEAVFGGIGIFPSAHLTGSSTFISPPLPNFVQSFNGVTGAVNAFVPSFHYALPLTDNVAFGLSVVAPYGLTTDWGTTSPIRYQATLTDVLTTDISPELGARITQNFSVGAGLDLQYARVKFNSMVGVPNFFSLFNNPSAVDSLSYNNGNSFGVGFHVGVMGMFNDNHTRIGLNYQSKMDHTFHGQSRLVGKLASPGLVLASPVSVATASNSALFKNNMIFSNPIEFPDVLTFSAYHDLNETIALLGSVVYTGWSSFQTVQLNNVAAPSVSAIPPFPVTQVTINSTTQEHWSDVWRVAVGANYHFNQQWMLRVGGGYDGTPTNNTFRDIRIPDVSRWAIAVGTHYQMRSAIGVDLGYTHVFPANRSQVNRTEALGLTSAYNVTATGNVDADLVGAQLVWVIDKEVEIGK
jgi:long-chain fatty acid transport protein